jgi:hypothetical protein
MDIYDYGCKMKWNIFRATRRNEPKDELQIIIDKIEKFAPKKHLPEREMYYYHYRQVRQYLKPLISLLTYISEGTLKKENDGEFEENLFVKLKNFYDINDKLSFEEALRDNSLMGKFIELFKIFYNDKTKTMANILEYFNKQE